MFKNGMRPVPFVVAVEQHLVETAGRPKYIDLDVADQLAVPMLALELPSP